MLVKITIPIPNYNQDDIFEQDIYFDCEKSPTKKEVIDYLTARHVEDSVHSEYDGNWQSCLITLTLLTNWLSVKNNGVIHCSSGIIYIHLPNFERNNPDIDPVKPGQVTWTII